MNVILITTEGYPEKFSANNSKSEFIAKGLIENGCKVTIVDTLLGTKGENTFKDGVYDNIEYHIFPRKGIKSLWENAKILAKILKSKKQDRDNYVILGMTLYPAFIITTILCIIYGYKRTALFHEWHIGMQNQSLLSKMEAWLKDKTFGWFLNGIFPISHFLYNKAKFFKKSQLFVPIMASYERIVNSYNDNCNFTYCGHSSYLLRNNIILDAFKAVKEKHNEAKLTLVLSGNEKQMKDIREFIKDTHIESIEIKYQISQEELFMLYDNSLGLLIPLDPNSIQDEARFSQKIAEYISSKRPIITNAVGEIPYYFENEKSAMIAEYSAESFSKAMMKLIENKDLANIVGKGGYNVGITSFEYKKVSKNIRNFLGSL